MSAEAARAEIVRHNEYPATASLDAPPLGVGVEVHPTRRRYPEDANWGRITARVEGGFEVLWNDRTITYERPFEVEAV